MSADTTEKVIARGRSIFLTFLPFWLMVTLFKVAAVSHYEVLPVIGNKLLPLWLVGFLIGGESLVQMFLDVPAGYLLDRFGYLRLISVSIVFFIATVSCFLFGLNTIGFIASIVLSISGWLFFDPGINAYVLSHAKQGNAGMFMSFRDISSSFGAVIASALLPLTLLLPVRSIGFALAAVFIVALMVRFFVPKDKKLSHGEPKIESQGFYIRRHFIGETLQALKKLNPASTTLLLTGLSASIFYGIVWFTVPLVIASNIAGSGILGIGLSIFDISIIILGFLLGRLADSNDKSGQVFFGLLLFAIAGMLVGIQFGWLFLLFGFIAAAGDEMASISLWAWLHTLDTEHMQDGAISGVINLFSDMGYAIGPILAGILYGIVGPSWTIAIGAVFILATWIVFRVLHRRVPSTARTRMLPHRPRRHPHKK